MKDSTKVVLYVAAAGLAVLAVYWTATSVGQTLGGIPGQIGQTLSSWGSAASSAVTSAVGTLNPFTSTNTPEQQAAAAGITSAGGGGASGSW